MIFFPIRNISKNTIIMKIKSLEIKYSFIIRFWAKPIIYIYIRFDFIYFDIRSTIKQYCLRNGNKLYRTYAQISGKYNNNTKFQIYCNSLFRQFHPPPLSRIKIQKDLRHWLFGRRCRRLILVC